MNSTSQGSVGMSQDEGRLHPKPIACDFSKETPLFPTCGVSHTPASGTYPSTMNMVVPAQTACDVTSTQTVTLKGLPVSERCVLT